MKALAAGAGAWAVAVPLVRAVGPIIARGSPAAKGGVVLMCVAIAAATTPLLARILGWRTPHERVRGVALGLGMAQLLDGAVHTLRPTLYSEDARAALGGAGAIFTAAGALGIFSAY